MWLRQSTAGQEILLGPFLDSTDGNTAETGLTIANTDIKLWVEGATTEANKNSGGATHIASGRYYAVLDATDTATLGKLEVNVHVTGALAVRREFMVLPANVYDSLVLGTDTLQADATLIEGLDATDQINAACDTALTDYDAPTKAELDAAVANVSVDEIQATALADLFNTDSGTTYAGAVAGSVVKEVADNAGGSSLTVADIADGVWDEAQAGHVTAGTFGEIATEIAAILVDTGEIGAAGAGLTAVPWNASWDAEVQSEVADGLTAYNAVATTDLPTNFGDLSISVTTGLVDITQTAADKAWATATRALTDKAGFTISGTKTTLDALNDVAATDIVSAGAITTSSGAVSNVTTVATTTTNTDMRGTDNAATAAALTTVDTVVDAIKVATDSLTFTVAGSVDANIQYVNDVLVTGTGASGDEWGP